MNCARMSYNMLPTFPGIDLYFYCWGTVSEIYYMIYLLSMFDYFFRSVTKNFMSQMLNADDMSMQKT
jgi:hypothetical protein